MSDPTSKRFSHVRFGVRTDVGRKRRNNEDAHGEWPAQGVFCVADGMGGAQDGEVASRAVVESLAGLLPRWTAFDPPMAQEDRLDALARSLDAASFWIKSYADSQGKKGCGSTFVGVCLDPADPAKATAVHAGDSRVYRVRGQKIVQITRDHSVAQMAGVKDEKELNPMFRSLILRAVGIKPAVETERTPFDVAEGDRVIVCSDGLSRMVPDREIAKIASEAATPDEAADALVDRANELGGKDNVTVVVLFVGVLPSLAGVRARLTDAEMAALFAAPAKEGDSTTGVTDGGTRSDDTGLTIPKGMGAFDTSSSGEFLPPGGLPPPPPALPDDDPDDDDPPPDTDEIPASARMKRKLRGASLALSHALRTPAGAAAAAALAVLLAVGLAVPPMLRAAAERKRVDAEKEKKACLAAADILARQCKELAGEIVDPINSSAALIRFDGEERNRIEAKISELGTSLAGWKDAFSPGETESAGIDDSFSRVRRVFDLRVAAAGAATAARDLLDGVRNAEDPETLESVAVKAVETEERFDAAFRETRFSERSYGPFRNVVLAWSNQCVLIQAEILDRRTSMEMEADARRRQGVADALRRTAKKWNATADGLSNAVAAAVARDELREPSGRIGGLLADGMNAMAGAGEGVSALPEFAETAAAWSNRCEALVRQVENRESEFAEKERKQREETERRRLAEARERIDATAKDFNGRSEHLSWLVDKAASSDEIRSLEPEIGLLRSSGASAFDDLGETARGLVEFAAAVAAWSNRCDEIASRCAKRGSALAADEAKRAEEEKRIAEASRVAQEKAAAQAAADEAKRMEAARLKERAERWERLASESSNSIAIEPFFDGALDLAAKLRGFGTDEATALADRISAAMPDGIGSVCAVLEDAFARPSLLWRFVAAPGVARAEWRCGFAVDSGVESAFTNATKKLLFAWRGISSLREDEKPDSARWRTFHDMVCNFSFDAIGNAKEPPVWDERLDSVCRALTGAIPIAKREAPDCLSDVFESWKRSENPDFAALARFSAERLAEWNGRRVPDDGFAMMVAGFETLFASDEAQAQFKKREWGDVLSYNYPRRPSMDNYLERLSVLRNRLCNSAEGSR